MPTQRRDKGWRILDYQEKALDSERNWIPRRDLNPGTLRAVVTDRMQKRNLIFFARATSCCLKINQQNRNIRGRRASGLVNKQTQMEERLADCWQKVIGRRVALSG
ncbi:uncharacterized protein LOC112565453 [Pomacea canaliculata]|uniref:uncharacterized protein LOC112565453 n=1 Tax=Pomacea canaliculata TaxID=400727 RepID=UPI000D7372A2|nr:uncharacterized protein LOC112565453 [Pomacea canaliculata]